MKSTKTLNGLVALEPLVLEHKTKPEATTSRFQTTDRLRNDLVKTKIVFDSEDYKQGDTAFVLAELDGTPHARKVYEEDGKKFIMVPKQALVMVSSEG